MNRSTHGCCSRRGYSPIEGVQSPVPECVQSLLANAKGSPSWDSPFPPSSPKCPAVPVAVSLWPRPEARECPMQTGLPHRHAGPDPWGARCDICARFERNRRPASGPNRIDLTTELSGRAHQPTGEAESSRGLGPGEAGQGTTEKYADRTSLQGAMTKACTPVTGATPRVRA